MANRTFDYDEVVNRRLRFKDHCNIVICLSIFVLGILSTLYKVKYEGGFFTCLRELTVDSTLFASFTAFAFIILNSIEIVRRTEYTYVPIYYFRLSSAVSELIVLLIVLIGFLPFVPDNPIISRFDMINMHVIIPLLTVLSFIINDPPIGRLKPKQRLNGLIFLVFYSVIIMTCIVTGIIPKARIPYSFMNFYDHTIWYTLAASVIIYAMGYLLASLLSELNRKVYWLWLRNIM